MCFGSSNKSRIVCSPSWLARQPAPSVCLNADSIGYRGSSEETSTRAISSRLNHSPDVPGRFGLVALIICFRMLRVSQKVPALPNIANPGSLPRFVVLPVQFSECFRINEILVKNHAGKRQDRRPPHQPGVCGAPHRGGRTGAGAGGPHHSGQSVGTQESGGSRFSATSSSQIVIVMRYVSGSWL